MRLWYLALAVLLVGSLLLGCAPQTPAPAPSPTASPTPSASPSPTPAATPKPTTAARVPFDKQELQKYVNSSASPGGSSQIFQTGWAGIISKYTTMKAGVTLIPGFKGAIEPLRKGEVDFFWLSPPSALAAYYGTLGLPPLRLRYMVSVKGEQAFVHGLWVLASSDIKEGKDLKGKKVANDPGVAWSPAIINGVMKANGWTEKDYTRVDYSAKESGFDMMIERKVDAVIASAGTETLEKSKTVGLRLVKLTKEETDAIIKIEPGIEAGMTPKDYMGSGPSQWGIIGTSGFWARADLGEKTAYTMVKALFENLKEFQMVNERAKDVTLETACGDMGWRVPYHPGAVRYYQEVGIWKADRTAIQKQMLEAERKAFGNIIDEEAFKELGILP